MWESPIYRFSRETTDERQEVVQKPFTVNVTYSVPRKEDGPGAVLIDIFKALTKGRAPAETRILDIGAGKLRNTFWFLHKGFQVWSAEFPELQARLADAAASWTHAATKFPETFHAVTPPQGFLTLKDELRQEKDKFDLVLLVNSYNIMPLPLERLAVLHVARTLTKTGGVLLWHQWRGKAVHRGRYTDENAFIDGHLRGPGPNHTFYVENTPDETAELLYAVGFTRDDGERVPKKIRDRAGKNNFSFVFSASHEPIIPNTLAAACRLEAARDPAAVIEEPDPIAVLDLYLKELASIPPGRAAAGIYHRLAGRIFFRLFEGLLGEPVVEYEIDEGRGRIDLTYKNRNAPGIFKDLKELRDIRCPEILVECKNYKKSPANPEFAQLGSRLTPARGMLGFLLCRDKGDPRTALAHCRDWLKGGRQQYIVVLDDEDLRAMGNLRRTAGGRSVDDYIDERIKAIVD